MKHAEYLFLNGRRAHFLLAFVLLGCVAHPPMPQSERPSASQARDNIARTLPPKLPDRAGWILDIDAGFDALQLPATEANTCAVAAVIAQESGFRVDPVIPGLPAIARREIDDRTASVGAPASLVHAVLQLHSPNGRTYNDRIAAARTEKELSDIFEDFIDSVPLGRTLFAEHNPIRTRGPMQVHVAFAEKLAKEKTYPYPVQRSVADEVFTRRGGIYFGIAHLLAYSAPYDSYIYRFADFNAGQFASRNAAFQNALSVASGIALTPDGALLPAEGFFETTGATESALRAMGPRLHLDNAAIHQFLESSRTESFEKSSLYIRVFELAERRHAKALPRAVLPQIELHGPKITRKLTTEWYARRVDQRFQQCRAR